jgi:cbb3-type cytochrome oxidase subunit 1
VIYVRGVFVPNRLATQWRRTHPISWLVYNVATSAAVIALVWLVLGHTVGIFAAGFLIALDLVLLLVTIGRVQTIHRNKAR